jgi:hypothetical protein
MARSGSYTMLGASSSDDGSRSGFRSAVFKEKLVDGQSPKYKRRLCQSAYFLRAMMPSQQCRWRFQSFEIRRFWVQCMGTFVSEEFLRPCITLKVESTRSPQSLVEVQLKYDGTRRRTGREVKKKLTNGVGGQYSSHYLGTWCFQHYYRWCAHLGCQ